MIRYRLTIYFVLTALVSITIALLVVNQVIGKIAEDQLTRMAEQNAVRNSIHMQAMLRGSGSGMDHTAMQMADMPPNGAMTPGMDHSAMQMADLPPNVAMTPSMDHSAMQMADMPANGAMTPGMNEMATGQDEPLNLEFLAGPEGLSRQYSSLVQGLGLVGMELLDLDHNSLWRSDPQAQPASPITNSQYELAVQGEISAELVRGAEPLMLDQASPNRDVVDVYLPLRSAADGPVLGVLKLSRDVTQDVALQVDQIKRAVLRVTVGTLAGLFLVLLGFIIVADTGANRSRRRELALVQDQLAERELAEQQLKSSLEEKGVLLKEIHHRVKNNMQLISSLLSLQSGYITDEATLLAMRDSKDRIKAMALVHEKLYGAEDLSMLDFDGYAESLVSGLIRSYGAETTEITTRLEIQKLAVDVDTAVSCGLIINELVSNALKYAFAPQKGGEILIELCQENSDHLILKVEDNGVGFPAEVDFRETDSLGLQLVCMMVEQLDGKIELDSSNGSRFQIIFPKQI